MEENKNSGASNGSPEAITYEMITSLDIRLSSIPVDMRAIPCSALSLYSVGGASPTYILPLTDAEFVRAYIDLMRYHLQAVETMYNDFMDGKLKSPDDYSQL